ncbi:MAG: glycosyltransferase [Bacteroidota bacterium]|nr:glycosyltransferase [Bacteroidota bacterium]
MIKELSVLYIGSLDKRSNSFRRYKALLELCPKTKAINTDPYILNKYLISVQHHFNIGPGIYLLNKRIRKAATQNKYDIFLVDNKPYVALKTLRHIKQQQPDTRIVDLLTDDPFGRFAKSWHLLKSTAKLYDIFFVQRQVNIEELKNIGVKNVEVCYRSYDPEYNRPIHLNSIDLKNHYTKVSFVGSYEDVRASFIAYLIQNGIPVTVTGAGWENQQYWEVIKPFYKAPFVYGDDYIKALCGMDICLHFLRHANRDEQDSRTFEIPSCGVFMLAEKSSAHLSLFEDRKEAVFFETKEELLQQVNYYLAHADERKSIALAGLQRCKTSGYSHKDRLQNVVNTIMDL